MNTYDAISSCCPQCGMLNGHTTWCASNEVRQQTNEPFIVELLKDIKKELEEIKGMIKQQSDEMNKPRIARGLVSNSEDNIP